MHNIHIEIPRRNINRLYVSTFDMHIPNVFSNERDRFNEQCGDRDV